MTTKDDLHHLVEELNEDAVKRAARVRELVSIRNAPPDAPGFASRTGGSLLTIPVFGHPENLRARLDHLLITPSCRPKIRKAENMPRAYKPSTSLSDLESLKVLMGVSGVTASR